MMAITGRVHCGNICSFRVEYFLCFQAAPATNESLTAAALAAAPPEKQKNMIGERLYPLIHEGQPQLAGKITGTSPLLSL